MKEIVIMPKKLPKIPKYTDSDLENAKIAVSEGMTAYKAAKFFGIPISTLTRKIKTGICYLQQRGRPSHLSTEDEKALVSYIITNCRRGHNSSMQEIMDTVKISLDAIGKLEVFPNNRPGYKWLRIFLKRNPRLKFKKYKYISTASCNVTESSTLFWFESTYQKIVKEYGDEGLEALKDPARNFNDDESGFANNPLDQTQFVTFDNEVVKLKMFGAEKVNNSINLTTCADGTVLKTLLLLPYEKNIPPLVRESIDLEYFDFFGGSGYETHESFLYYLEFVSTAHFSFNIYL